jgi:NADPH2:quinone reductase
LHNRRVNLELQSTLRPNGDVELSLTEVGMPQPDPDEIVVEMLASPMHPADQSLLFARADPVTAERVVRNGRSVTRLRASEPLTNAQTTRWDNPMPVGMEGAGRVVSAGANSCAQALLGRLVALWGGGMYVRYRKVRITDVLGLPDDVSAAEGAAAFVNPLTALGMLETMREEGFTALVHTAAASTLGQIICRLCQRDKIGLVNIVRKTEHVELLRSIGAEHVCDMTEDSFDDDLRRALRTTGATLCFDATGGGTLASRILHAMEQVCIDGKGYQHYGSDVEKKVFIYGTLDSTILQLLRNYGLAWNIGGWLVFHFLKRVGPTRVESLKRRVAAELKTTFAMKFNRVISLEEACDPDILRSAARRATGEKYLVDPTR